MSRHDEARAGLWAASTDQETWPCCDFFDTREEAIAYGREEFANADGEVLAFWVGQVSPLTDEEVADAILRDEQDANECLCGQDEWAWCEDDLITASKEAWAELRGLVVDWVKRHGVRDPHWHVEDSERISP